MVSTFFYGIRARSWRRYYWLDLRKLAENLLLPHQSLTVVRYFTARVYPDNEDQGNVIRQTTYLEALATLPDLSTNFGIFRPKEIQCYQWGTVRRTFEEKMTDVNISVALLDDAQDDLFDTAMIISADSDLVGPIQAVFRRYPNKRVLVAFPPRRRSVDLSDAASAHLVIGQDKLRRSQFPDEVARADGYLLQRPPSWT